MSLMDSFFGSIVGDNAPKPQDIGWARTNRGDYHRLSFLEDTKSVQGQGGIVVCWHGGVRPAWVFITDTDDIAQTIAQMKKNQDIQQFEVNGGLYVTWSKVVPQYRDGVVRYLSMQTNPRISVDCDESQDPIPVYLPG